jgi:hypothetical protein
MTMPKRTCIQGLPDGRFTISDIPEERPPGFAPISLALSAQELREELVGRGVAGNIADDLIECARRKGTEIF